MFLLIYFSTFLSVLSFFLPFFFLLLFPLASLGLLSASQATSKARNNLLKCIFVSSKRTRVFSSIFPPFFGQRVTRKYAAKLRQRLTFIITIRYHRFKKNGTSDSFVRASSSKENSSNELGDVPRKNYAHVPPSNLKTDAIPLPSLSLLVEERIAPRNEERKEGRKGKKIRVKEKGERGRKKQKRKLRFI